MESDDSDTTEKLELQLFECCEEAYKQGLSTEQIHNILFKSVANVDFNSSTISNIKKPSKHAILWHRLKIIYVVSICILLLAITSHFIVCSWLAVNPLNIIPFLQEQKCIVPNHQVVMQSFRPIVNCTMCSSRLAENISFSNSINSPVIELSFLPSREQFEQIAYSSRPIIVRRGGQGMQVPFSFKELKTLFESEAYGVQTVSEECQFLPFRSPFKSLEEAFELISDSATWDEPWYIGWSNCHPGVASKIRNIFPRPNFLPKDSESSAIDWVFIGSPGLGAAMHIDTVRRPSWQAQLSGVKTWFLRPPPECEADCDESVQFTIHPGDLLFLDTNTWYHETFIEGESLSISIGSEYD